MYTFPVSPAASLDELLSQLNSCKRHTYRKGEYVFSGQHQQHLYLICAGQVKIGSHLPNGRAIIKDILSEGDLFGEATNAPSYSSNNFA